MDWFSQTPFLYILGAVLALVITARFAAVFAADRGRYCSAGVLLTGAELNFFNSLQQVVPAGCYVACKVRLADILLVGAGASRKAQCRAFNRIKSKHADFVLCDVRTFRILGVIELDDRSHLRKDRRERDEFFDAALKSASLPVLRVPARREYEIKELRTLIFSHFPQSRA